MWVETFTIGVFILSLRFSASSSCTPAHGTSVRVRAEPLHTVPVRLLVCLCLAARVFPDRSSATIHSVRDRGDRCSLLFLLCRVLKPPEFEDQDSASGGAQRTSLGRPYLHAGDKALLFNSCCCRCFFLSSSCSSAKHLEKAAMEIHATVMCKGFFLQERQAGKQVFQRRICCMLVLHWCSL